MTHATEADRLAVAFARVLRGAGIDVPVGATMTFAQALGCVGLAVRERVYWAGRATLVKRPEDIATYDRAFAAFWLGHAGEPIDGRSAAPIEVVLAFDAELPATAADDAADPTRRAGACRCGGARPRCSGTSTSPRTRRPSSPRRAS